MVDGKTNAVNGINGRGGHFVLNWTNGECPYFVIAVVDKEKVAILGVVRKSEVIKRFAVKQGDHQKRFKVEVLLHQLQEIAMPFKEFCDRLDKWTADDEFRAYLERERAA